MLCRANNIAHAKCGVQCEWCRKLDPPQLCNHPIPHAGQRAVTTGPRFDEQGSECQRVQWDPKGGELYLGTVRPWETAVEAGHRPDVQIELSDLGIGAKDSSNPLVAGFLRSFPQDSRSWMSEEDELCGQP